MTFISGDPWAICDYCGFKYRKSQTRKNSDGFIVCAKDWEPPHPQERVRIVKDNGTVRDARPRQTDVELSPGDVTADDL